MRTYEIVYILDSALDQAAANAKLEIFHEALGGEITTIDHWGVRQLAYPIGKAKTGYYVIVQVTADPTALPEYERLLRLDEETMRYLLVLNEGQPTSGASILADRPPPPVPNPEDDAGKEDDGKEDDAGKDDDGGKEDDGKEDDGEEDDGGDKDEAGGEDEDNAETDDNAETGDTETAQGGGGAGAEAPISSGPPIFTGARGRRRRHEGPRVVLLNYKDVTTLSRFLTEQGKILPKRTTKVTARFQRQLGTAVKRARHLALLPFVRDHEG